MAASIVAIRGYLGDSADDLLNHKALVNSDTLSLPGPDFVDRIFVNSDRPVPVLNNLGRLYGNGRLGGTGYVSILPIDQGIEHSAGASFAPNPIYFDPENIVRLAIDGGSAGGYTTLCALAFRDVFAAGASLYGLSDLVVFVGDTHKFESRYLESLIGPWPQREDLYRERSAINSPTGTW